MDERLIQRTRYLLRSRVRRVQTCRVELLPQTCGQLVDWLDGHLVLAGIVHRLRQAYGESRAVFEQVARDIVNGSSRIEPGTGDVSSIEKHASVALAMLECARSLPSDAGKVGFYARCCCEHLTGEDEDKAEDALEVLRDNAIDVLYEYVDEQIDSRIGTFGLLVKYKQRSEWFHAERLRLLASGSGKRKGERALAEDLYCYLLDEGVDFVVEPVSRSGEADLVLRDGERRQLVVDAKHIRATATPSDIRSKLAAGFHQVARYCADLNEPYGFLVPFLEISARVRIDLEDQDGLQFLNLSGKTIYYFPIDLADLPSASKAGRATELRITRDELVATTVEDEVAVA